MLELQLAEEEGSDLWENLDTVKILRGKRPGLDIGYSKEERKLVTSSGRAVCGRTGSILCGMARRKVCTHTAIPACNELLEQWQGRDSSMSQMGAYLEEGNGPGEKHQTVRWRERPTAPLPKHCSDPHLLQGLARGTSSSTRGKGEDLPSSNQQK